jgi:hypothetical protein
VVLLELSQTVAHPGRNHELEVAGLSQTEFVTDGRQRHFQCPSCPESRCQILVTEVSTESDGVLCPSLPTSVTRQHDQNR